MTTNKNITGIILAGGKSSRMGTDKGFVLFKQKPFIEFIINALEPLVSEILIVTDNAAYDTFGYKRINDLQKNAGPVAGICSGLNASSNQYNLILSCDIPMITSNILNKLIDEIDDNFDIIQIECEGKTMPLIALYSKNVLDIFHHFLQIHERRLRIVVNACKVKNVVLDSKNSQYTMNVNTQKDLFTIKNEYNS